MFNTKINNHLNFKVMNKFKLFPLALAAFAFSACTSEDVADNNPVTGEGTRSYVAVNINNVGSSGTRADVYENGNAKENAISKVRFYFFTQNGGPYKMTDGTNWKEISPVTGNGKHEPNIERITDAMLVIDGSTKAAPYSMMAVVNPQTIEDGVLTNSMSKSAVENAISQQNFKQNGNDATDFVMSNSVYVDGGQKVWASNISGYVQTTAEAATAKPVDIFVERVAVKIETSTSNMSELGDATKVYEVGETTTGKKVYVKINGWGIANENNNANLVKQISLNWNDENLGFAAGSSWNIPAYKRCFWENSARVTQAENRSWNAYSTTTDKPYYTLPNTTFIPKYVVAAQLVYADGQAAEICSYKGVEYLSENDVKNAILNENKTFFKKNGNDYNNLAATDIVFNVDADNGYEVRAKLAEGVVVYKETADGWVDATAEAKTSLAKDAARIYKSGMTYYYTNIKHLGAAGKIAEYGLVRNHIYKIDVTNIKGFGTPVYDPDHKFDPVIPEDVKTYLAAKLNVLSWRVVSQSVELGK